MIIAVSENERSATLIVPNGDRYPPGLKPATNVSAGRRLGHRRFRQALWKNERSPVRKVVYTVKVARRRSIVTVLRLHILFLLRQRGRRAPFSSGLRCSGIAVPLKSKDGTRIEAKM
jgi:hypothetical protein